MFDQNSRYAKIPDRVWTSPSGRQVVYKDRRFLPRGSREPLLVEVEVQPGDRLDLVAWRTLGNPLLFWRIADANDAMNPFDLVRQPGQRLRVAMPRPG